MVINTTHQDTNLFQGSDVLIIGNGFDLDLGLKTRYKDFYESCYWPFNNPTTKMGEYLQRERQDTHNWMDLETKLGDYAYFGRLGLRMNGFILPYVLKATKEDNISDYNLLVNCFRDYLSEAEKAEIMSDSTAARILEGLLNSYAIPHIFSFNYTNLQMIADKIGINTVFDYKHIHGSIAQNNIILGVGEKYSSNIDKHLPEAMDFLYKTSSPDYNPPQIADILNKAPHITFFGLTLGGMDAPYFSGLFQNLSSQYGKTITFFTYDEDSRLKLLRHLRNVEAINLHDVWTRHTLEFIRTGSPEDQQKVDNYLQRLKSNNFKPVF